LALLKRAKDPRAALNRIETALDIDPNLIDALQLRARLGELSALDVVERLIQSETLNRLYNASCALAVLAETASQPQFVSRALSLLGRALEVGFPSDQVAADPDWNTLCDRPEFQDVPRKAAVRRPAAVRLEQDPSPLDDGVRSRAISKGVREGGLEGRDCTSSL
jgi:eukaryotic-like serine/threonine-protein kinase